MGRRRRLTFVDSRGSRLRDRIEHNGDCGRTNFSQLQFGGAELSNNSRETGNLLPQGFGMLGLTSEGLLERAEEFLILQNARNAPVELGLCVLNV